jgi:hypothetical protein
MSNNSLEIPSLRMVNNFTPISNFNQEVFKNYHDSNRKNNQSLFGNFGDNFPAITLSLQSKKHRSNYLEDNLAKTSQELADIDKINRKLLAIDDEENSNEEIANEIIVKNNNQPKQLITTENSCQLTKHHNKDDLLINDNEDKRLLSKKNFLPKPNNTMVPSQEKNLNSLLRKKENKSQL